MDNVDFLKFLDEVHDVGQMPLFEMTLDEASIARELAREGQVFWRFGRWMVDYVKYLKESVGALDLTNPAQLEEAIQFQHKRAALVEMINIWNDFLVQINPEEEDSTHENS